MSDLERLAKALEQAQDNVAQTASEMYTPSSIYAKRPSEGRLLVDVNAEDWKEFGDAIKAWKDAGEAFIKATRESVVKHR